ncbi:MAG: sigma-70 family RNA polymerase sigma factor [Thermoanaerobaculia bacterium]
MRVEDGAPPEDFPDLVRAHEGIIRRIARAYGDTREEREDLAQEICLQLWRACGSFGGRAKVSTWVYSVALNTAVSVVRRRARRPRTEPLPESLDLPAGEREDRSGEVEMLYAAMRRLGEAERALVLLWLEERSYGEIAEVLGLTVSNVSVRLVRVKEKLKALVDSMERGRSGVAWS